MTALPYRLRAGAIELFLRVTPNAGADRIDGVEIRDDGNAVLRLRVRAVPDGGRANDAVIALLAQVLDRPKRDFELVSGATSRMKTVRLAGAPDALLAALDALLRK